MTERITYWVNQGQNATTAEHLFLDCGFQKAYFEADEDGPEHGGVVVFESKEGGQLEVQLSAVEARSLLDSLKRAYPNE